jgi:hypothetical protein
MRRTGQACRRLRSLVAAIIDRPSHNLAPAKYIGPAKPSHRRLARPARRPRCRATYLRTAHCCTACACTGASMRESAASGRNERTKAGSRRCRLLQNDAALDAAASCFRRRRLLHACMGFYNSTDAAPCRSPKHGTPARPAPPGGRARHKNTSGAARACCKWCAAFRRAAALGAAGVASFISGRCSWGAWGGCCCRCRWRWGAGGKPRRPPRPPAAAATRTRTPSLPLPAYPQQRRVRTYVSAVATTTGAGGGLGLGGGGGGGGGLGGGGGGGAGGGGGCNTRQTSKHA